MVQDEAAVSNRIDAGFDELETTNKNAAVGKLFHLRPGLTFRHHTQCRYFLRWLLLIHCIFQQRSYWRSEAIEKMKIIDCVSRLMLLFTIQSLPHA
jgi:hypothetical protein